MLPHLVSFLFPSAFDSLKQQSEYVDVRLSKREFRDLLEVIVENMPGPDSFDNFVEFLTNSVEVIKM